MVKPLSATLRWFGKIESSRGLNRREERDWRVEAEMEVLLLAWRPQREQKRRRGSEEMPSKLEQDLQPDDQFLIFASDGLWEQLSNQEAVEMVQNHPRNGIAKRLVKAALHEAAKKREMRYSDLNKIERGVRRHFHDDITVVVLFLDTKLLSRATSLETPSVSIRDGGIALPKKLKNQVASNL